MGLQFNRLKKRGTAVAVMTVLCMVFSLIPKLDGYAAGWGSDFYGWYYHDGSSYYYNRWAEIGGYWYYFTSDGYMDYSEYRDGCWLGADGVWNTAYANGTWKVNSTGWWFEDNNWYACDQWLWINGSCYHFDASGYMETKCYRDGCWITESGAWDTTSSAGKWVSDASGWWFEDNGWYPKNQGIWIDGAYYWFGSDGYWDEAETEKKRAEGNDGRNGTSGSGDKTKKDEKDEEGYALTYGDYGYSVIPMLPPFNDFFYIKTDNPDPDSFNFIDESTVYSDKTGSISPISVRYSDVVYEDAGTGRVKGGYIFRGSSTDGGELTLQVREVESTTPVYNITTGETTYEKNYKDVKTDAKLTISAVVDDTDYLIQTYGGSASDYFGKMSAIQSGLNSICLYSGASIRGSLVKSTTTPYYGLSTSPHVDQNFYIQDPYSRKDGKKLLVSDIYPYRYDSLGFPSALGLVSKRIEPSATYSWNQNYHYLMDFTYNGQTKSYGGAGYGGGQQITESDVNYWYKFDGSDSDAYKTATLDSVSAQLKYYGSLKIESDIPSSEMLTIAQVKKTVGTDGAYVNLLLLNSVFGGGGYGFTYLYDNGSTSGGSQGFVNIGYFNNAWYDGRYFNTHEYFEKGTHFGDESAWGDKDTGTASIIIKDALIKVPNDGNTYKYNSYYKLSEYGYNESTGRWSGFTTYYYDSESGNWICNQLKSVTYKDASNKSVPCSDPGFIDACTLTPEEVEAMGVDRNADVDPARYYIYDRKSVPGTLVEGGN